VNQSDTPTPIGRHDGWTPERKALFLEHLAANGNVSVAAARVGMGREAAYRLRRRESLFARGWDVALLQAREVVAETIGDRAMDGIEEPVFYRGEQVGTRRKYDTRLLLARMARLDRLAEQQAGFGDELRFDEILACLAGAPLPAGLERHEDDLPPDRYEHVGAARTEATRRVEARWNDRRDEDGDLNDEDYAACAAECEAEAERAGLAAAAVWDDWHARACAAVDALHAPAAAAGPVAIVAEVSTSPAESAPRWRRPE
jgi:hypothetical protein